MLTSGDIKDFHQFQDRELAGVLDKLNNAKEHKMTISYLTLRRWIGILALAFPILLLVTAGFPMQNSLSATYWTPAGDIFTAMLFMIGIFLLTYNGYDKLDRILTMVAGFAMMGVALFPCGEGGAIEGQYTFWFIPMNITNILHYIFSGITFTMLGVMSTFQFTQSKIYTSGWDRKKKRNRVYRICGYIIFGVWGVAIILQFIPNGRTKTDVIRLWYWLESIMVWAFGVSWLVKGETLWRDK